MEKLVMLEKEKSTILSKFITKKTTRIKHKYYTDQILINQVFVDFDVWVENIPKEIDYTVGRWIIKRTNDRLSRLEKRIDSLYQCHSCGVPGCKDGRCKNFKEALHKLAAKNGVNTKDKTKMQKLKKLMDRFCHNCGKTGGHQDLNHKCIRKCKFCGSHDHNSTTHPKCPFWNAWDIITLLYNLYFARNQMNAYGYRLANFPNRRLRELRRSPRGLEGTCWVGT